MKLNRRLIIIASSVLLWIFIAIPLIYAQGSPPPESLVPCEGFDSCKFPQLLQLGRNIFLWLVYLATAAAVLTITYAGIQMVVYATNDGKRSEAKHMISMAIIGLIVTLAAWLIVETIMKSLTDDDTYLPPLSMIYYKYY